MTARNLLEIADEIRAIATTGLHFTGGEHDRERYQRLVTLAARVAVASELESAARIEELYLRADAGYVTPKLDVRLALFRADEVLLVRERSDGCWSLPGGYIDVGDSPAEAALRETAEEAGVAARVTRLVGVFDNRLQPDAPPHLFHIYKLVFTGELAHPDARPRAGSEADAAAFHPLESLPELSRGRTLPLHIEHALRVARAPEALPHFD